MYKIYRIFDKKYGQHKRTTRILSSDTFCSKQNKQANTKYKLRHESKNNLQH